MSKGGRRRPIAPAVLVAAAAAVLAGCGGGGSGTGAATTPAAARTAVTTSPPPRRPHAGATTRALRRLEQRFDGHLGVYAVDTGSGAEIAYHADERFAYASTFKAFAASAVLRKVGLSGMDRVVRYTAADLLANSPVSARHVGAGMTLDGLAAASVRFSDNTAGNLLIDELGGVRGYERALARIGDHVTTMRRREPELSVWHPGQTRDTSTPRQQARDLRAFVLGDVLRPPERARLTHWLKTNTTGDDLIRAGVPTTWTIADKTGTGATYGARNDLAIAWRPNAPPIAMAIMFRRRTPDAERHDHVIAEAASVVAATLGR